MQNSPGLANLQLSEKALFCSLSWPSKGQPAVPRKHGLEIEAPGVLFNSKFLAKRKRNFASKGAADLTVPPLKSKLTFTTAPFLRWPLVLLMSALRLLVAALSTSSLQGLRFLLFHN